MKQKNKFNKKNKKIAIKRIGTKCAKKNQRSMILK